MPRATTATRRPVPAPPPDAPERIVAATIALLAAIEGAPAGSPAATAFRSALRRRGQALTEVSGPAALADVLAHVRTADTARADAREAVLTAAWADLAGWGA